MLYFIGHALADAYESFTHFLGWALFLFVCWFTYHHWRDGRQVKR